MNKLKYISTCIVLLSFALATKAQTFVASATIESAEILIGDQVNFEWQITSPKGNYILFPNFTDSIVDKVEIIRKSKLDSIITENELTLKQSIVITSFDSGYYHIPSFDFKIIDEEKDTLIASTNDLFLYVNIPQVDTTQAIKDIKAPIEEPITIKEVLPWILGGIGLVGIIIAVIFIIRRMRKSKPILMRPKPKIPPHITALNELARLKEQKLWQSSHEKRYHSELTEIVRTYIEGRFSITAMEMTSDEIIDAMVATDITEENSNKLKQMLTLADLVKFAKAHPLPTEHDLSMKNAVEFVETTKQEVKVEPVENTQTENNFPTIDFDKNSKADNK